MKSKKIFAALFTALLAGSVLAGCSDNGAASSNAPVSSSAPVSSAEPDSSSTQEEVSSGSQTAAGEPTPADILADIEEVYGENFMATMDIPDEMFEAQFPVDKDLIQEKVARMPMISAHADYVVIIRAVDGKGEEVEKQLTEIRENLVNDTMQYPSNLAKVQSSQVVRNGDTVAFLMVGAMNEDMDATEEEALEFAQAEVQKAVDAFNAAFA